MQNKIILELDHIKKIYIYLVSSQTCHIRDRVLKETHPIAMPNSSSSYELKANCHNIAS